MIMELMYKAQTNMYKVIDVDKFVQMYTWYVMVYKKLTLQKW